jgi:hypothetical protein
MPRLDGTGPMGQGAMTGRGMGNCQNNGNKQKLGVGYGKGNCSKSGRKNCQKMGYKFNQRQNFTSAIQPLQKDEVTLLKNQTINKDM